MQVYEDPGFEVTKTISVKITDFSKMKEEELWYCEGPKFKVGGKELYILIQDQPPHIGIYLVNCSKEKIKASGVFKNKSGWKAVFEKEEIDADEENPEKEILCVELLS